MATRTISTDLKLTGEKEFNDGMKAINSNLKVLKSDMAACAAEYADNENSVEALTAKNKILTESVDQQKVKVEALREKYRQVCDAYGENSAQADKYKIQLNNATAAMAKQNSALKKNQAALDKAQEEAQDATKANKQLGKSSDKAAKSSRGFGKAALGAAKAAEGMAKAAKKAASGVGKTAAGMTKGVGLISAGAMAAVAAMGVAGTAILGKMVSFAKDAAAAAQAAHDAGETLTPQQEKWLAFSGQLGTLEAAAASAKSALGNILLPALSELSTKGAEFLSNFSSDLEAAGDDTSAQTKVISDYLVKGAKGLMEALPEYVEAGKELFKGLGDGLSESGPELLDMGMDLCFDLLEGIIENAPALADGAIQLTQQLLQGLTDRGPDLMEGAVEMVTQIIEGLAQAAPDMIPAAVRLVGQLLIALVEHAPDLLIAGIELVLGVISGIANSMGELATSAEDIIETIKSAFSEKAEKFLTIGKDIVHGIWDGIQGAKDWIFDKISGWVGSVVDWIKEKLGIASPSKVMRDEVGYWMAKGLGVGFEHEMQDVNRQIAASINTSFNIPKPKNSGGFSPRNYTTPQGKQVNLYFYAQKITEADIDMIVEKVDRKLGDAL